MSDKHGWISVKDELPPKGAKPVLICVDKDVIVGSYYRASKRWISKLNWRYIYGDVTHWQPLPKPPTADPDQPHR